MDSQQNFIIYEEVDIIKWPYSVIKSYTDSGVKIRVYFRYNINILYLSFIIKNLFDIRVN